MQTFSQFYNIIENNLSNHNFNKEFDGLYDPVEYIMTLPAKRIRPILFLLSYQLYKKDYEKVVPIAIAIEWFHNFTLMHDDIIDAAPLRRGFSTVHNKFGNNSAILSGDVLLIYAYEQIRKYCPVDSLSDILMCFNDAAIKVCEGQQRDIEFEEKTELDFNEYEMMISYKTAVLLACSLKMGAIVGLADKSDQDSLYSFGLNLGLAFQIQDDYLDIFGDNLKVGKQKAGDIIQAKKTAPFIITMEKLEEKKRNDFAELYANISMDQSDKVQDILKIYFDLNIYEEVLIRKNKYQSLAMESLKNVSAPPILKQELIKLAEKLLIRQT